MALTKRYVSPGAEERLFQMVRPTPSGEVELVDYMGGDPTVLRVATAGHGKSVFKEEVSDFEIFSHLVSHGMLTPFRSVHLQFLFQAPIEVALDFVYDPRASVNEYSGRYSVMIDSSFLPSFEDVTTCLSREDPENFPFQEMIQRREDIASRSVKIVNILQKRRSFSSDAYKNILETDFARELARAGLGIDNDTRFYWKMDLVSLADFVDRQRRLHSFGLTRGYVEAVANIAKAVAPGAWNALQRAGLGRFPLTILPTDEEVVDPPLSPAAWEEQETKRVVVPALEEVLFAENAYLADGAFQVVDYLGDDSTPARAARTSYGEGTKKLSGDEALIRTLVRDLHTSPIEMTSLAFEARTPLFVDPRQAGRHRTLPHFGFMGYFPLGSTYYLPPLEEMKYQDRLNRQGRGNLMDDSEAQGAQSLLRASFEAELASVQELRALGAPEFFIRAGKGVGFYTRGWRCGDGHNLSHFLRLRLDPHAQKEIRDFAALIDDAHRRHTPTVNQALHDYHVDGMRLSRLEVEALAGHLSLDGADIDGLEVYRSLGLVRRKKDGGEKFLTLEGQGFQRKLRRFLELRGKE